MNGTQNVHQELQDTYIRLAKSDVRVGRLEAENAALRTQLADILQPKHDGGGPGKSGPDLNLSTHDNPGHNDRNNEASLEKFHALNRRYAELQATYLELQNQHAGCQRIIDEARQKARNHKNAAKEWKKYSERKQKQRTVSAEATSTKCFGANLTPQTEQQCTHNTSAITPHRPTSASSAKSPRSLARIWDKATEKSLDLPSSLPRLRDTQVEGRVQELSSGISRVTSSQTTTEDGQDQGVSDSTVQSRPNADDESEPTVIFSRSRKRKAGTSAIAEPSALRIKEEPDLDETVIELHSEPTYNQQKSLEPLKRMETSDLDATGAVVVTPHRPKPAKGLHLRATSEEAVRLVPQLNRAASSLSEGAPALMPTSIKAHPGEAADRNQRGHATDRTSHSSGYNNGQYHGILQQVSSNVSPLVRSKDVPTKAKPRTSGSGARGKVALLSEDGDDGSSLRLRPPHDAAKPPAAMEGPLEQMLNEPLPARPPNLPALAHALEHQDRPATASSLLITPVSAIKRTSPLKRPSGKKMPRGLENSPAPVRPEEEPLRLRDVKSLRLQDFKINPKYMGTDYAFSDTLRGRDQRRALHTCNKPDCCGGALQKVIAMGGTSLSGKTDAQALEAYMGPNWRDMVDARGAENAKELTLQAHAHCFADQYGKHRQAFVRRSTPPGFWRTDFPTTQEVEDDREKAREMERNAVEDRYREAMREGGRWKFRDE